MDEKDHERNAFLKHWFTGFTSGIEAVSAAAQAEILQACGKACAHSYTVALFREARQNSADLDSFLLWLSQHIPHASYERISANTIRVSYTRCECDLVQTGWVTSPMLCQCSAANLRENLEQSLGVPVSVAIESTLLRGGESCIFAVTLGQSAWITG